MKSLAVSLASTPVCQWPVPSDACWKSLQPQRAGAPPASTFGAVGLQGYLLGMNCLYQRLFLSVSPTDNHLNTH